MVKVSVIIPAYNAMTYLPKAMESLQRQTFTDMEIIIVNDGSEDHIVEWFSGVDDPKVKLIDQSNQGTSAARNTGINQAKGEYIAFLDADDLWASTKLEKQVDYLDNHADVGLVYTWTSFMDESGQPTGEVLAAHAEGDVWERLVVIDGMISNGSVPMVRRICFETVGLFDRNLAFYEDRDMWIRIASEYSFGVIKEVLTFYRRHTCNASKNRQEMLQGWQKTLEKAFKSAPFETSHLKNRSYGCMGIHQSWLSLEQGDLKEAVSYRREAVLHYPKLRFSKNFIQLTLAIMLTRWFGLRGYEGVRSLRQLGRSLRRQMPSLITR